MTGDESSGEGDASPGSPSVFERNQRLTLVALIVFGCVLLLVVAEIAARLILGLGDRVLYQSSPLFGYRPQPDQLVYRRGGAEIRINNLGLRADRDWDSTRENKVLFLGNSVTYGGSYIGTTELFSPLAVEGAEGYFAGNAGVNGWGVENIHALIVGNGFTPASIYVSVLQEMDFYRGLSKLAGKAFWTHKPLFALEELLAQFHLQRFESIYNNHDIQLRSVSLSLSLRLRPPYCVRCSAFGSWMIL